ncbi:MAG: hypothetical protein ABR555_08915 [Pyrinomonadaceae bacterium]
MMALTPLLQILLLMSVSVGRLAKLPNVNRNTPVAISEVAPALRLKVKTKPSHSFRRTGKNPVVLVFYRGYAKYQP